MPRCKYAVAERTRAVRGEITLHHSRIPIYEMGAFLASLRHTPAAVPNGTPFQLRAKVSDHEI